MEITGNNILHRPSLGDKKLALLLDPEKANLHALPITDLCHPDFIFVGGSTGGDTTDFIRALKEKLPITNYQLPIILFPGNASQFSPEADAILYATLAPEASVSLTVWRTSSVSLPFFSPFL